MSGDTRDGAIREAGGAFGKREKAQEDQYFRKMQQQQLKEIHDHHHDEIAQKEAEINRLKEDIKTRQEKIKDLEKQMK